jgi:hypothetical protein
MAHHGNTPAAWTGVTVMLIGFLVGGVGLVVDSWLVFWIGVVIGLVAPIIGKIMQVLGMGAEPRSPRENA